MEQSYYCEVTRCVKENIGYFIARINNYNGRERKLAIKDLVVRIFIQYDYGLMK